MKPSFWHNDQSRGQHLNTTAITYPVTVQHSSCTIHTNGSGQARLHPQEPVVQQCHFRQELAKRSGLNVIIVRSAYLAHPTIWRTIVRYPEVKRLQDNALALQNLLPRVSILRHSD